MLFLSALFILLATGCGTAGQTGASSAPGPSRASAGGGKGTTTTDLIPSGQRLRGDGDADNPGDIDGNVDADNDKPTLESYRLPDNDDKANFAYGHPASAAEVRTLTSVVTRYYAAAASADGATACKLFSPMFAKAVPGTYGGAGPSYLRGGSTCPAVMSMLFKHNRSQLAGAIEVIEVRVDRDSAQVLIGSRTMPASDIRLEHGGGVWKIGQLLGLPLP